MIIAVASGKGGTGKTMVATNLALSIEDSQYIDCDVEEPNGNLFLHAEIETLREADIPMSVIDKGRCTLCGDCAKACEFNALAVSKERVLLFSDLCHGCGVCSYVCPEPGVITEQPRRLGEIPFSPEVRRALAARKSPVEFDCGAVTGIVERMWSEIEERDRISRLSGIEKPISSICWV
jgi:MinD superfamily P-loop ATPase